MVLRRLILFIINAYLLRKVCNSDVHYSECACRISMLKLLASLMNIIADSIGLDQSAQKFFRADDASIFLPKINAAFLNDLKGKRDIQFSKEIFR